MNSNQRRKILRKTGKVINMNTVTCYLGHKARPTEFGYWCSKCQEYGSKNLIEHIENGIHKRS